MDDIDRFDATLMGILQTCGKIESFLDAVLSFLSRRTDYFLHMHSSADKLGFPPGVAEKMIQKVFQHYQKVVLDRQHTSKACPGFQKLPSPSPTCAAPTSAPVEQKPNSSARTAEHTSSIEQIHEQAACSTVSSNLAEVSHTSSPGKCADSYNGAVCDGYSWSQTSQEVEIRVKVPPSVKHSKQVLVDITQVSILISLKDPSLAGSGSVLLCGQFSHRVKSDALWSLLPGECVHICLDKTEERLWESLLIGDQKVDTQSMENVKQASELDPVTHSDLDRVLYDHHQKLLGKPTSHQQKTAEILKNAWNAEGSPFQGTPFDLSRVNIAPENGQ